MSETNEADRSHTFVANKSECIVDTSKSHKKTVNSKIHCYKYILFNSIIK